MLHSLSDEAKIIKSFFTFKDCPKQILQIPLSNPTYSYMFRILLSSLIFIIIIAPCFYFHKINRNYKNFFIIITIHILIRIISDFSVTYMYIFYFVKDTSQTHIIPIISFYTDIYLIILTFLFAFFPRLSWIYAYVYAIFGNLTFRRKFNFVIDVAVEYKYEAEVHFGNIVGMFYFALSLIWFRILQDIIYKQKKNGAYYF